jgi:hypothetical protein
MYLDQSLFYCTCKVGYGFCLLLEIALHISRKEHLVARVLDSAWIYRDGLHCCTYTELQRNETIV